MSVQLTMVIRRVARMSAPHQTWMIETLMSVRQTAKIASVNRWRRRAETVAGPGWVTRSVTRPALRWPASVRSCAMDRVVRRSAVSPRLGGPPGVRPGPRSQSGSLLGHQPFMELPIGEEGEQQPSLKSEHFFLFFRLGMVIAQQVQDAVRG